MADDFELRLKALEDREAILYEFINELRRWSVEHRAEIIEIREEVKAMREVSEELREDRKETRTRIDQNERMIVSLSVKLDDFGETQRLILRVLDRMGLRFDGMDQKLERMDQKLDDLGKPGKNGTH